MDGLESTVHIKRSKFYFSSWGPLVFVARAIKLESLDPLCLMLMRSEVREAPQLGRLIKNLYSK